MSNVENDPTRNSAQPAVIVANVRSGGTFLAHCLSNHPQIFCDRAESLHHSCVWYTYLKCDPVDLLRCLLHMQGYRISMCKLTYTQAWHDAILGYLVSIQPRVIWLHRRNAIRQAVSVHLNKLAREGKIARPQHTFESVAPIRLTLDPALVIQTARELVIQDNEARLRVGHFKATIEMTYDEMIGGERAEPDGLREPAARRLCEFLGVPYVPLQCELKRVNPAPLCETLVNWDKLGAVVRASELAYCLEDEWTS